MAEDLNIKVKVTPDTSGVQGELNGQAGKFNLPVKVSLQNVADVQTQIQNIGKNIDVKVNLTMAQNGVKNQLNSLKNQKVDMQLFDTTKLTQELNKVSSAIEKAVSKIQIALSTKIDSTMKATASNVENLGKSFGTIQTRIDSIKDTGNKAKMQAGLDTAKKNYDNLIQLGTLTTEQFSGMATQLAMVNRQILDIVASEKKLENQAAKVAKINMRGDELIDSYNRGNANLKDVYDASAKKYRTKDDRNAKRRLDRQQNRISGLIQNFQNNPTTENFDLLSHEITMYERNSNDLQSTLRAEKKEWEDNEKVKQNAAKATAAVAKKTQEAQQKAEDARKKTASNLGQQFANSDFSDSQIKYFAAKNNGYSTADMKRYFASTDKWNTKLKSAISAFNNDPTEQNLKKLTTTYNGYITAKKKLDTSLTEEKSKWEKTAAGIKKSGEDLGKTYSALEQKKAKLDSTYTKKVEGTQFTNQAIEDLAKGQNGTTSIATLFTDAETAKKDFEKNMDSGSLARYKAAIEALTQALAKMDAELTVAAKSSDQFNSQMRAKQNKYSSEMTRLSQSGTDLQDLAMRTGHGNMVNSNTVEGKLWGEVSDASKEARNAMAEFDQKLDTNSLLKYEQALQHLKELLSQFRDELTKTITATNKMGDIKDTNAAQMSEYQKSLQELTTRYNTAVASKQTGGKDMGGLLAGTDLTAINDAYSKAEQAKARFEQDMDQTSLAAYKTAMAALAQEIRNLTSALDSADNSAEKAFSSLPTQMNAVEGTLKTLKDTYRAQQNRGKSDAGVENTIQLYTDVLKEMRQIEASGSNDYSQFTEMFKKFDSQLQASGININNFTDFMRAMNSVATQAKVSIGDLGNEFKQQQNIESLNKRLNNLLYTMERYVEINKKIQGNSGAMNQYNSVKSDIQSALRSTDGAFKESTLSKAAEGFSALKKQAQDLGLEGKTLSQVFQNLFGQHFSTMVAMGALHLMQNSLQQVYQNVVDIDTAMTELKKVTDETSSTYSKFLSDAGNQAKELGASVSDVVSATADFARLGYNLQDANEIAESAIMFNRVGDGVSDVNEASEDIISAMKAFNIEAENSQQIVDKYNEVGNNYAISSAGVANALTRSAAALHAAGNDINQSIGMIVAANDVAQDPEQVGNALKVLSLRIRGATTELEAMGEDADGAATSTAKLQAEIKALSGVNIMKDRDTFKSTYEILDELADKWDSLTDVSKASILEDLAGKNRASVVAGMLENWDDAKKAMETAQKSAGSAEAELETALDSVQGKLSQFQATFQSFSETVLDSDLVKGIIDFGTSALDAADGFTKWAGVIPTLTAALSAFLSLSGTKTQGSIQMLAYAVGIAA